MRIFPLLLSFLFLSASVQSQAPAGEFSPEEGSFNTAYASRAIPKVTGKLTNMSADELKSIAIQYTLVTPFYKIQTQRTTAVRPDGSFTLQLDYPLPYQQIWLSVGDYFYTGLLANKDLTIELDMQKIKAAKEVQFNGDGVSFGGTDGQLNAYLNNYILYKRPDQLRLSSKINTLMFSQMTIDKILDSYTLLYDSVKQIQDSYIAASPSPIAGYWKTKDYRTIMVSFA